MFTMDELLEQYESADLHVATYYHEDGSVTEILYDEHYGDFNPRTEFDHVAKFVSTNSDYVELDETDDGIEEMRNAASFLGERGSRSSVWSSATSEWRLSHHADEEREEFHLVISVKGSNGGSSPYFYDLWLDLDDEYEAWAARAYFEGLDLEGAVQLYLNGARPDVLHYEHSWSVQNYNEYNYGYAYVLFDDLCGAIGQDNMSWNMHAQAEALYRAEMREYADWFAGEVYMGIHIFPTGQEHEIGEEGGYYTGRTLADYDSCHGFIGYDDLKEICGNFTSSPVIDRQAVSA